MAHRVLSKTLSFILVAVVMGFAGIAYGDKDADKRTAGNSRLSVKERMAACEKLLATDGLSKTDRAWALCMRGSLNRRGKKYDAALADFAAAEKLEPDNPRVFRYRGNLYFETKKYKQSEADLSKALELEPRNSWTWYTRGRVRGRLRKYQEALKDHGKALEIKPRYSSAYSARAWLHLRLKNYDKAVKDCDGAIAIDPYYVSPYIVRGNAYALLDKNAEALHDMAVARTLAPNMNDPKLNLKNLIPEVKVSGSTTKPAEFQQPKKGLSISYLMTTGAAPPKMDEMEEAIGDLAAFFKKKRVPEPKSKTFVVREVIEGAGDMTNIKPSMKYPGTDRKKPPVASIGYFRTLFPSVLPMGRTGQVLTIEFDKPPLKDLWPLKVGNKSVGQGKYVFVATDPVTPQAKFLGAKKPGDKIPFGTVKWSGEVVKTEKVVVPAGVFDTFVIRVEEKVEMVMMGATRKREVTFTWWYSPSVRWWVKRTQQSGENISVNQAETIK
ncbi:MAG: tetratricopeptide repeat protein [Phycisphaerales bacterium]|jgi:tetratricopeptide (TPR) repeat protein|nr:tetratricopeptide repeat protein [Phycisphaerales bacterium]